MKTLYATRDTVEDHLREADLVVGAVLVPGARAPRLVTRADLARMRPGAVVVDVSIDQGGCFETSRPTSHREPTYVVDGIVHYCVTNMPGAAAHTATYALANAILPPLLALADAGWREACRADPGLRAGLNLHRGRLTHRAVAESLGRDWLAPEEALGA
jgi:alanine dehydrogenase